MISLCLFYLSLRTESKWIVTLAYTFVGFTSFPTLNISFAYSSEVTFPIKEATASGLFILGSQALGIGMTNLLTVLQDEIGSKVILIMVGVNLIGTISAVLMKSVSSSMNMQDRRASLQSYASSSNKAEESIDMHEAHWVKEHKR